MRTVGRVLWMVGLALFLTAPAAADGDCDTPGNLTHNCNFDRFVDGGNGWLVPEGWTGWALMGSPAFDIDDHGSAPGAPAQRIWSDGGTWTAGLFQQIEVTPGKWYETKIDWAAPNVPQIERRLGIDPTGGTDPASPQIVWGPSSWEEVRMPDLRVSAFVPGSKATVFVWTHHGVSYGADQVFLDAVTLVENADLPAPTPLPTDTPTPQPTRKPPTATASPLPASATPPPLVETATPTETAVVTPTEVPALPSETPTVTATPTATVPPPTRTPTPTSTPTLTPVPVAELAQAAAPQRPAVQLKPAKESRDVSPEAFLLVVAGGAVGMAVALFVGVIWLWVRAQESGGEE